MKSLLNNFLKIIGLAILYLAIGLIAELLGSDVDGYLRPKLGDNYVWIIVTTGILLIAFQTIIEKGKELFSKKKNNSTKNEFSKNQFDSIRADLIESYQNRINSKLANRYPINLELNYSLKGTSKKAPLYDNSKITFPITRIKGEIQSIFDHHNGRLLIIGAAGAGKTTLLLQLAISLLKREKEVIPIIVNIATWQPRFNSVNEWFLELLPQMGFSKGLVKLLLEKNSILPLFDGLDELPQEQHKSCLGAIGNYGSANKQRYVICCRTVEYSQTVDAPVYCQIEIKPLTLAQIETQLKVKGTPEANGMLDALQKDKYLREVLTVPFYLNTVQLLFSTMKAWEEFGFKATSIEGRQQEIIEVFTTNAICSLEKYNSSDAKLWLSFLANRMNIKGLVVFELIDLQYDWWKWEKKELFLPNTLSFFTKYPTMLLPIFLFIGLFIGLLNMLEAAFVSITFSSLLFGILTTLNNEIHIIQTKDNSKVSFKSLWIHVKYHTKIMVYIFLTLSMLIGLIFGVYDIITGDTQTLLYNLLLIPIVGVIMGMVFGLLHGFTNFLEKNTNYLKIQNPYERFQLSLLSLHPSILQHALLHYQFYQKRLLPLHLVDFLNQLSLNNVLESDGGTWRFRHRILQDYFSGKWKLEHKDSNAINNV